MKPCVLTLILGALGALTAQAASLTAGEIHRIYVYSGMVGPPVGEDDGGTIFGSTMDFDFKITLIDTANAYVPSSAGFHFTDHVVASASLFCITSCSVPGGAAIGTVDLNLEATVSNYLYLYPGPSSFAGLFSAMGSFSGSGLDIPLTGGGTTTVNLALRYDLDPGYYYYGPGSVQYQFIAIPEPTTIIPSALVLSALLLRFRRRSGPLARAAESRCTTLQN